MSSGSFKLYCILKYNPLETVIHRKYHIEANAQGIEQNKTLLFCSSTTQNCSHKGPSLPLETKIQSAIL